MAPARVVVAPDKFKGSLKAVEVADAVIAGIAAARPDAETLALPVADGGDGTVDAAVAAGYDRVPVRTVGPTGEPVSTSYALRNGSAVVELASAVGLDLLRGGLFAPMDSSTRGLGIVIGAALDAGARTVVIGLGGSASTDGGAGMVQALGAKLLDDQGVELPPGGWALARISQIDFSGLRRRIEGVEFVVALDVESPLLGPTGAAAVFGPQKGADAAQIADLERGLARWSTMVRAATGRDMASTPGAGAAGGTGYAALAVLGATAQRGIELVLDLIDFHKAVVEASLVVTGEGSLDEQSLTGKAPIGVARAVAAAQPTAVVVAVAGRSTLDDERLKAAGLRAVYPLSAREPDAARSMASAAQLLTRVGAQIAAEWLP
jgi:glycerate kinase